MVTEAMINPDAVIDQQGEWLEIYNTSTISIDIRGFRLSDMGSDSHIITSAVPVIVPPQSFLVLGRNANESTNGGVRIGYQYASYTLGNSGDEIILSAFGTDLDSISYPSNFDQAGISKQKTQSQLDTVDSNGSTLWCASTSTMAGGDLGTPGYENLICP